MSQLAIDQSSLLSVEEIRSLLGRVESDTKAPGAIFPFLASVACAGLLPGEAARLRVDDVMLTEGESGHVLVGGVGGRKVPVGPELGGVLRRWVNEAGLKPGDLLFPGERGGALSPSAYRRVWRRAREVVLSPDEVEAGLGERITSLRDSRLDMWLKARVPVWAVAEWAGVSASWLALRYPHHFCPDDVEVDWGHLAEVMALPMAMPSRTR